jgi:dihydrofolate reductase
MGKLVVSEFVSLDGVFEDPGGVEGFKHGGWTFRFDRGAEGDQFKLDELRAADVLLLGRVTYDGFAAAWPAMESSAGEFGVKMNAIPKYVVSGTLERADWNNSTVIAPGDAIDRIAGLKDEIAGDILVAGSGQLVRSLMRAGLVDEYRLMLFPIVLGTGKQLFEGSDEPASLRLLSVREAGDSLILTYEPR